LLLISGRSEIADWGTTDQEVHVMPSTDQPTQYGAAITVTTGGWSSLLEEEERHAARQGFGAGVIIVSFASELLRRVDDDGRALLESAIVTIIEANLRWTDRGMTLAPGRFGIVTIPVDGTLSLAARARSLHDELQGRDLAADVAYALRRDRGGLSAAAARADAALDTSAARRRSPLRSS
jgi:hypothetical protein